MKYEIKPLTEEEEIFIEEKINVYGDSITRAELITIKPLETGDDYAGNYR